jgi:hypothetical protein
VAAGGVNNAVILRFLCFRAAAFFSLFSFCCSVRTLVLRFGFGFGFGFALVLVFLFVLAAFFVAVDFGAVEVDLLLLAAGFLFVAVARPVCALGRPGRLVGTSVA